MIHLQAKTTCVPTTSESDCRFSDKIWEFVFYNITQFNFHVFYDNKNDFAVTLRRCWQGDYNV